MSAATSQADRVRVNEQIRYNTREVRLIVDNKQLGIVSVERALQEAEQRGLDLVEVAPNANPPVCKIMDYGKYRYEQTKREREARQHSHQVRTKEIKFRPSISEHDYETKKNHVINFLQDGHRVKLTCYYRGRENAHQEMGVELLNRFVNEVSAYGAVEQGMKRMGSVYTVILGPLRGKGHKQG